VKRHVIIVCFSWVSKKVAVRVDLLLLSSENNKWGPISANLIGNNKEVPSDHFGVVTTLKYK